MIYEIKHIVQKSFDLLVLIGYICVDCTEVLKSAFLPYENC